MPSLSDLALATSVADLLRAAAETSEQPIVFVRPDGSEQLVSYAELFGAAEQVAAALREAGVAPRSTLLLACDQGPQFLPTFWGALLADVVPVPLANEAERVVAVWQALDRPAMVCDPSLWEAFGERAPSGQAWRDGLVFCAALGDAPPLDASIAYLQFSSGSTATPRGVELTHAALLANLRQIITACSITSADVVVTWMPYYHDMGLIAMHLVPVALSLKQVSIDPLHFARRPSVWLEAASRHRGTLLTAATFALALVTQRVGAAQVAALDLSAVRMLAVGAEPVAPSICRAFVEHLAAARFDPLALIAVYGLAEACAGVTCTPLGTGLRTYSFDRAALVRGEAVVCPPGPDAIELSDVGAPLPDCEVRIVDDADVPLAPGRLGHVQIRGPQLMRGYHRAADPGAAFCDGWLRTGDLGVLLDGRLVVNGRSKEIVVVNGRKFHAPDLEELIRSVPGLELSRAAVCGSYSAATGRETVVACVPVRAGGLERLRPALHEAARRLRRAVGSPDVAIVALPARNFPRTTSGKLQRVRLRERYEAGDLDQYVLVAPPAERPAVAAALPAPADLERELRSIAARALALDAAELDPHRSLLDLGATSIQLMELLGAIGERFGREPDPAALRARPTLAALADWLRGQHPESAPAVSANPTNAPSAIVAMACRFPDADTPEQFWTNLASGRDSVRDLAIGRADGAPSPRGPGWGSMLDQVAGFDAAFFGISSEEADAMDPQQRLLLELAYEALEQAGYAGQRCRGVRIGVFVGVGEPGYQELMLEALGRGAEPSQHSAVGTMRNLAAARIAHALDLNGPAIAIDTACSSALVALHLAHASIQRGECDLALVGAANLNLTDTPLRLLQRAGALSPTGRSRAFDDSADGFAPGEGAAIVLLESLERAQAQRDPLLALVRGGAVNNDGQALSPMAPNPLRQAEVLQQAYANAGIDPASISYIEAHGTGTPIGDPIEARTLAQSYPNDGMPRFVGSVKTNVGHLLNAAGMPALIKVVLMLRHGQIPPTLHQQRPSRRFDLASAGLIINRELRPWDAPHPRRAGINSFGFGGTNVHMIVEEAPAAEAAPVSHAHVDRVQLLAISAGSLAALTGLATGIAAQQRQHRHSAADLCYSASLRAALPYRAALLLGPQSQALPAARGVPAALHDLAEALGGVPIALGHAPALRRRRVAWLFAGQGAQYPQQGRALYAAEPEFRRAFDAAAQAAGPIQGRTLQAWCFDEDVSAADLAHTAITQPLLVAFEIALAKLLLHWGVQPEALLGHSVGEIAAAHVAGALSLDDAMRLAVVRGQLLAETAPGAMLAALAPEPFVRDLVARRPGALAIAAFNSPTQLVIAGKSEAVAWAGEQLQAAGHRGVALNDRYAFHSPLMRPVAEALVEQANRLAFAEPRIPLLSTANPAWLRDAESLGAAYWGEQLVAPVQFSAALSRLRAEGFDTLIEIGPGNTLTNLVRHADAPPDEVAEALLQRGSDDAAQIRAALGRLWVQGVTFDVGALVGDESPQRVPLPPTPFDRRRHWLPEPPRPRHASDAPLHLTLDQPLVLEGQVISSAVLEPTEQGWQLVLRNVDGSAVLERSAQSVKRAVPVSLPPSIQLQQLVWHDAPLGQAGALLDEWRILPDADGHLAAELRAQLAKAGASCALIEPDFSPPTRPYGVVVLAGRSAPDAPPSLDEMFRLVRLVRTISALPPSQRPAGLWVVTTEAYATGQGNERPSPNQALVAGLAQALPDQRLGLPCFAIDLDGADDAERARLLLLELRNREGEAVTAWRAGRRLQRALQAVAPPSERLRLMPGEVVLIVGGAGGVGGALARALAPQRPRLVLLGRSALGAPQEALLAELRGLGAQAQYRQLDCTDAAALDAVLPVLIAEFGAIGGVIQAAGAVELGSLDVKDDARIAALLAPKVQGTWLLVRALERLGQRPRFFLTCSSIASSLPGLGGGLAEYVAGNAYLDTLAASERRAGRPMTALGWLAWQGVGMAAHPAIVARLAEMDIAPLAPADAAQALVNVLGYPAAHVVLTGQPSSVKTNAPLPQLNRPSAELTKDQITPVDLSYAEVAQFVRELLAQALRCPPERIALDTPFLAMGLDSLQAVDLVRRLERQLGRTLPLTLFFEFQTVDALVGYLTQQSAAPSADAPEPQIEAAPAVPFPLAPAQLAFYASQQLYPELPAFTFLRQRVSGPLDTALLRRALEILVARHEMLRAQFAPLAPEQTAPEQHILPADALLAEQWLVLRDTPAEAEALQRELLAQPFDLHRAPLFRVMVAPSPLGGWEVLWSLHHIIADGWSIGVLASELWQVYTHLAQGRSPLLQPAAQFREYVSLREDAAQQQLAEQHRAWWAEQFGKHGAALGWTLPQDGDGQSDGEVRVIHCDFDAATSARLRERAAEAGVSLFHWLLAAYARCLAEWSAAEAVAINVAEHGRAVRLPAIERMVGCCADQLPLLIEMPQHEALAMLAARVRDGWLDVQRHNAVSALDLARLRPAQRGTALRSVGAATFSFARFSLDELADFPLRIEELRANTGSAATRLTLVVGEYDGRLSLAWHYAPSSLREETVAQLAERYAELLTESPVVLPSSASDEPLVPHRILHFCETTPEAVAVRFAGRDLTYGELGAQSGQLAALLAQHGATFDQPIGLLTLPGIATIVGIVGILRSNATWLLLNSEYPTQRLCAMLKLAGARIVLYQQETESFARQVQAEMPDLVLLPADALPTQPSEPPLLRITPDNLAYVIFTSGSTGTPKGVPIPHRAIGNYVTWLIEQFGYTPKDRLLQAAAISFGAAVSQILGPLCSGGTVVPLPAAIVRDPDELLALVERERPTIWRSVPSLWERLLSVIERRIAAGQPAPALDELRWIGVGGEPLPPSLVRRWMDIYGERHRIANHYGPSETTINATCYVVPGRPAPEVTRIPIGTAIRNTVTLVVDEQGQPCPPGQVGELLVGGVCLSPGYLGRPDLTAERFIAPTPALAALLPPQIDRLYRTGDLVRALPDGNLEFIGRSDDQIKIRGYRVELGEIEAVLLQHPAIARAAVIAHAADDEHVELVAYLETNRPLPPDAELRRWLLQTLPQYMVPHRFLPLPLLPTTPSGKIDRQRLREWQAAPPEIAPPPADDAPTTESERLLAEVWCEVLKLPNVSRYDNFFELGGDSLLILQVLARLKARLGMPLRAAQIYQHTSLAELAAEIDRQVAAAAQAQPPIERPAVDESPFPLSPAQLGFALAEALTPDQPTTWCARLRIVGALDVTRLEQALNGVVARHGMLRTQILADQRPIMQRELASVPPLRIAVEDLSPQIAAGADASALVEARWQAERARRFALSEWPLLRLRVLSLGEREHVLLIAAHHIIGDGWSGLLFGQELLHLYDALMRRTTPELPLVRSSFREYVAALASQQDTEAAERFWRAQFAEPYRAPTQWRKPSHSTSPMVQASVLVEAETLARLRRFAAQHATTLYVLLLGLFARAVRRLAACDDVVIGTALAGRDLPLPDIERLFGCCATALPLRVRGQLGDLQSDLRQVGDAFAQAYQHALPPGQIARLLPPQTSALTVTGAQFFFTFVDLDALGPLQSDLLQVSWDDSEVQPPPAGTDLLFSARPLAEGLRLMMQGAATACDTPMLERALAELRAEIAALLGDEPPSPPPAPIVIRSEPLTLDDPGRLDAALVGYLPSFASLATLSGWPVENGAAREQWRGFLFPNRQPRWLEALETPLGRSGMVCLPWFADELVPEASERLLRDVVVGVQLASDLGARAVSLAGLIPAHCGYGYALEQALAGRAAPRITTGHATTVVAVVRTVAAALAACKRDLAALDVAVLGLGSIGSAALQVVLRLLPHPRRIVLCDRAGSRARLAVLAEALREQAGFRGEVVLAEADPLAPEVVYEAQVIVGASSAPNSLSVALLRPGTLVIDDSFPPCVESAAALRRMREQRDVLICGGGMLQCGLGQRTVFLPLRDERLQQRLLGELLPGATASCQLESLLLAHDASLPATLGLVTPEGALRYAEALERLGWGAAPLHWGGWQCDAELLERLALLGR
jgi:amino acid adenylation domain-containing protein